MNKSNLWRIPIKWHFYIPRFSIFHPCKISFRNAHFFLWPFCYARKKYISWYFLVYQYNQVHRIDSCYSLSCALLGFLHAKQKEKQVALSRTTPTHFYWKVNLLSKNTCAWWSGKVILFSENITHMFRTINLTSLRTLGLLGGPLWYGEYDYWDCLQRTCVLWTRKNNATMVDHGDSCKCLYLLKDAKEIWKSCVEK